MIQPLWKTVWRFLNKLGLKPPNNPAIPLLGIHPEETMVEKDTCITSFNAALFRIARTWKQPTCPLTDEWIKKLWDIPSLVLLTFVPLGQGSRKHHFWLAP